MDNKDRIRNAVSSGIAVCDLDLSGQEAAARLLGEPAADLGAERLAAILKEIEEGVSPAVAVLRGRRIWR